MWIGEQISSNLTKCNFVKIKYKWCTKHLDMACFLCRYISILIAQSISDIFFSNWLILSFIIQFKSKSLRWLLNILNTVFHVEVMEHNCQLRNMGNINWVIIFHKSRRKTKIIQFCEILTGSYWNKDKMNCLVLQEQMQTIKFNLHNTWWIWVK